MKSIIQNGSLVCPSEETLTDYMLESEKGSTTVEARSTERKTTPKITVGILLENKRILSSSFGCSWGALWFLSFTGLYSGCAACSVERFVHGGKILMGFENNACQEESLQNGDREPGV